MAEIEALLREDEKLGFPIAASNALLCTEHFARVPTFKEVRESKSKAIAMQRSEKSALDMACTLRDVAVTHSEVSFATLTADEFKQKVAMADLDLALQEFITEQKRKRAPVARRPKAEVRSKKPAEPQQSDLYATHMDVDDEEMQDEEGGPDSLSLDTLRSRILPHQVAHMARRGRELRVQEIVKRHLANEIDHSREEAEVTAAVQAVVSDEVFGDTKKLRPMLEQGIFKIENVLLEFIPDEDILASELENISLDGDKQLDKEIESCEEEKDSAPMSEEPVGFDAMQLDAMEVSHLLSPLPLFTAATVKPSALKRTRSRDKGNGVSDWLDDATPDTAKKSPPGGKIPSFSMSQDDSPKAVKFCEDVDECPFTVPSSVHSVTSLPTVPEEPRRRRNTPFQLQIMETDSAADLSKSLYSDRADIGGLRFQVIVNTVGKDKLVFGKCQGCL